LVKEPSLKLRLVDLPDMHACLIWDDIIAAAVAVLDAQGFSAPYPVVLDFENMPDHGSGRATLQIISAGVLVENAAKARRTHEPHRLVELAAIAIAGLALHALGGHQIRDVALRGSAADYLVDEENRLLEVAGRSRRNDFHAAWDARWERMSDRLGSGFYVCVTEFETPASRLAFAP
jgi:hypothetical protein